MSDYDREREAQALYDALQYGDTLLDDIRAALARAEAHGRAQLQASMVGDLRWQPIETPPKTGAVIVWNDEGAVFTAPWDERGVITPPTDPSYVIHGDGVLREPANEPAPPTDPATLADRIQAWREDEMTGYDTAIELLCEAETALREQAQTITEQKAVLDTDTDDKDYEIEREKP